MHIQTVVLEKFSDTVAMLQMPEFNDFSLLYVLPTFLIAT
jgi:hypothetical protein